MNTSQINPPETASHPSNSEWERLLNRVIESTPFRRSTRLRDFLIYVGNEVVVYGARDLPEQQIGVAVFGRAPMYDTSQDNIVRVNAMELRKRIDLYFANEGQKEPLIFEIPRGSYIPVFRIRQPLADDEALENLNLAEEPVDPGSPPPLDLPQQSKAGNSFTLEGFRQPLSILLVLVIACLVIALVLSLRRIQQSQATLHKWQSAQALSAFWGNFFGRGLPPEIVLADSSFGLAQDILHKPLSLSDYVNYTYRSTDSPDPLSPDSRQQERKDLAIIFNRSSGSIGDFRVARRITELETGDDGTRLVFAREYASHRLRWNNTIFIGSSRSNPWVELFEDRMAYRFEQSRDSVSSVVTVDKPTGNEQAQYEFSSDSTTKTAYCVIVFVPNPTNTGNTLILAGTDSQATEAGGDFMTSEENLEKLQTLLRTKAFPYFQLLLRISRVNGTPLESEVISYRIAKK